MIMAENPIYSNLEEIRLAEKRRLPFRGFLTSTSIETTKSENGARLYKISQDVFEKEFRPSLFRKILIVVPILCFLALLYSMLSLHPPSQPSILAGFAMILFLMAFLVYEGFLNKKKNYIIHLDNEGIRIDDAMYRWTDIRETAILQLGFGRGERDYLVLLFKDGSYKKFRTDNFLTLWGFRAALSAYIEYFKKNPGW